MDGICTLNLDLAMKNTHAYLVSFNNGQIKNNISKKLKFKVYESAETEDGLTRKRPRKILMAETKRMEYIGYNFGSETPSVNSSWNFVGILNKEKNHIKLCKTQLFHLISLEEIAEKEQIDKERREGSYREKIDQLTKSFGSKMKKKQLESRLQQSVNKSDMEFVATKAVEEVKERSLCNDDLFTNQEMAYSDIIPSQNKNALLPKDVYKIQDIISDDEYNSLEPEATIFLNASKDQIMQWQQEATYGMYIIDKLKIMPQNEERQKHNAKLLAYFYFLMQLSTLKAKDIKKKDPLPSIPTLFKEKILDKYTVKTTNRSGKLERSFPNKMKDKLAAHALVLALFLDEFEINLNQIQPDFKIPINRLATLAGALGCKVTSHKDQLTKRITKLASLNIPLFVLPEKPQRGKRN